MTASWQFWIDVGGTFTDCIGVGPQGEIRQFKTLSSGVAKGSISRRTENEISDSLRVNDPTDFWVGAVCRLFDSKGHLLRHSAVSDFKPDTGTLRLRDNSIPQGALLYELDLQIPAPVLAVRWILRLAYHQKCPKVNVRFGTTRGTNALLTRTGARTALITTQGFGDVPLIGNQDRPELFDLNISKPESLFTTVVEIDERIAADGTILRPLKPDLARQRILDNGIIPEAFDSVAVCLINAFRNPQHEEQLERVLRTIGFSEVSRSSEVSPLIRFVPRCDTTVLDAYLNPVLRKYLNEIRDRLPGSKILVMTSTGGLVDSRIFRGRDCILSGPAGGIVGFSKVAVAEGFERSIGFDMGGTSTDVARFDGRFEFENETTKAGVRIMSPALAIETVAAGGGSICGFDGARLSVGPASAGATPGPACYGAGGPLTVTDLNVFLGRVLPHYFPFPLQTDAIRIQLQKLHEEMLSAGIAKTTESLEDLAEGLLKIANDNMIQAIRQVSVANGYHPSDYALVSFGGAGGQHCCSIARSLNIRTILIHPFAGILSAYGMGQAEIRSHRQISILKTLSSDCLEWIVKMRQTLERETAQEVAEQGVPQDRIAKSLMTLQLRYVGTDSVFDILESEVRSFRQSFESEHERLFGYLRPEKEIEVASLRIETIGSAVRDSRTFDMTTMQNQGDASQTFQTTQIHCEGSARTATIIERASVKSGDRIIGPAILCERTSTVFIEPNCTAEVTDSGTIKITIEDIPQNSDPRSGQSSEPVANDFSNVDPVLLEVFNNQFVSIAKQMGETLRRTSTSTNVRERLDFSCALFDEHANLVVNAPHVPVHLGAMGETVRSVIADHSRMQPGDVFVTNDPYRGGSHLPDVTVVTPVFAVPDDQTATDSPAFYVANRAHHAEIGGIVPGSMPPFSTNLAEEGVLICSRKLVDKGRSCERELAALLTSGSHPSRAAADNLADLAAQTAANECGVRLLRQLTADHSVAAVQSYMQHIQTAAARRMRLCLSRIADGEHSFQDQLDDGTSINVCITVNGDRATVDFTGTDEVHSGNLNANRAIATAAVLYCLRCLLNEPVPLNAGVLEPVEIVIPESLLNPPPGKTATESPAIVGGNVETSQRIVDVLLGALGLAAASQGTMNNLTFGDETFGYYETICGGAGATMTANGADAVHTHMTNTRLTDPEVLEQRYPVRLRQFSIRKGSGGAGKFCGGDGIVREIEFLKPLHVSMLSQRRETRPYGIQGGAAAKAGRNVVQTQSGTGSVGGSFSIQVVPGDLLRIETPGGGGAGGLKNEGTSA